MSDDLDDLLRRAMKTLDDQVPSGYFEGLPKQALARLEDSSMQTTENMGTDPTRDAASGPPPQPREEDSGLHDIRSLASSTKARLSSRRSTQHPIVADDDVLASTSAGWKAVALPEPAKMVSLPSLAELPTKAEVKAADKAAQKAAKAKVVEDAVVARTETALETKAAPAAELPAAAAASTAPAFGARIAGTQPAGKKGRGATIALVGVGIAAAAGAAFYFGVYNKDGHPAAAPASAVVAKADTDLPKMSAPMMPAPAPHVEPIEAAATGSPPPPVDVAPPAAEDKVAAPAKAAAEPKQKVHKVEIRDTPKETKPETVKVEPKKDDLKKAGKNPDEGEPSFDALLKEAGVSDQQKQAKPVLDKKSLSGSDIKNGMGSVASKAQACFSGTQGTATVKLTVAPSGQVEKVHVTGVFAGTPVASCVENAVKSASFPAWDGGPQTFGYSYLLAE